MFILFYNKTVFGTQNIVQDIGFKKIFKTLTFNIFFIILSFFSLLKYSSVCMSSQISCMETFLKDKNLKKKIMIFSS